MLDYAVGIAAARGVKAHLEVAVVHVYLVEAELAVGVYREPARPAAVFAQRQIPELYRVVHCDEKGLFGVDIAVIAEIFHVAQPAAARVFRHVAPHRLPRNAPVVAGLVVTDVDIVPGAVHRHAVRAETRDAVVFWGLVQKVSARRVVEHAVHVPHADIVCPRHGQIDAVYHVFAAFIVKMAILHIVHLIIKFTLFYNYIISAPVLYLLRRQFVIAEDAPFCFCLCFPVTAPSIRGRNPSAAPPDSRAAQGTFRPAHSPSPCGSCSRSC